MTKNCFDDAKILMLSISRCRAQPLISLRVINLTQSIKTYACSKEELPCDRISVKGKRPKIFQLVPFIVIALFSLQKWANCCLGSLVTGK